MLKKKILAMAIVSALVTGCNDSDNEPATAVVTPAHGGVLAGTAAKGIVKKGKVDAYMLDASGNIIGEKVGSSTTDDKGLYSLTLESNYDGISPLLIELTAGADTKMICDVRAGCGNVVLGDDIPLAGTNFKLSVVSPTVGKQDKINTSITPFTSMAASHVIASGAVSDINILQASSKVSQLVGVNITQTTPVNIAEDLASATPESQRYTIMLAALANQAFVDTNGDGVDINDVTGQLAAFNNDFIDGNIGSQDGFSPSTFYTDTLAEVEAAGDKISSATATATAQLATVLKDEIEGGSLTPEDTIGDNIDEVAQAKAFVAEVRTWANSLGDLENPANEFIEEARTIRNSLDSNSQAVISTFAEVLATIEAEVTDAFNDEREIASTVTLMDNDTPVGTISIETTESTDIEEDEYDDYSRSLSVTATDLNGVTLDIEVSAGISSDDVFEETEFLISFSGEVANNDVKLIFNDATYYGNYEGGENPIDDSAPPLSSARLAADLYVQVMENGSPTGEAIQGIASIAFVQLDNRLDSERDYPNGMDGMSLESFVINSLTVGNSDGSHAGFDARLHIYNATSFDALAYLDEDKPIYIYESLDADTDFDDYDFSEAREAFGIEEFEKYSYGLGYDVFGELTKTFESCASGLDVDGNEVDWHCINGDVISINEQVTDEFSQDNVKGVQVDYIVIDDEEDSYGIARLELDSTETAEHFLEAGLTIRGGIRLEGHKDADLVITADKTGFETGNLSATLLYSGKSLTLSAATGELTLGDTEASLSFSNADGTKISISKITEPEANESLSGEVIVNGKQVGIINQVSGGALIRYNDGSFESL